MKNVWEVALLLCLYFCVFDNIIMSIASTLGLTEVFQKYQQSPRIMILLKCISIMIHFDKCIKYQYRDTILNQVSVSVSRYNLEVSYPTLDKGSIGLDELPT